MLFFAFVPCGAMLVHTCIYDPASYLFERTQAGCVAFVKQMSNETNGLRVIDGQKVCIAIPKPANVD